MCILCGSQEEEDIIIAREWGRKESIFDNIIDKIIRFNETRMEREMGRRVTSLRTLCAQIGNMSGRNKRQRQQRLSDKWPMQSDRNVHLRDTATSIDNFQCFNGPSEI